MKGLARMKFVWILILVTIYLWLRLGFGGNF